MSYTGWIIPDAERTRLLKLFPPHYPDVVAHHITCRFGVADDTPLPSATSGTIIGYSDNGTSVQALIVQINGSTQRPDGKTYHITWSLDRAAGAKPVHSNNVIVARGFVPVAPVEIVIAPHLFE